MLKTYYVYILASKRNGTLYIGVTNNLERRIYEHNNHLITGFTDKYNINTLVHFEQTNDIQEALQREKRLKKWNRKWKLELIEKVNPQWKDLSKEWIPDQVGNDKLELKQQRSNNQPKTRRRELEQKSHRKVSTKQNYLSVRQAGLTKP